ncbi:MAG: hypothetical protein FD189_539 [Elusimicrobia bacterium]|nr:MAG: hypothetical protein FD154_1192 [Elusimicrobiota bacterium]KAF0157525.1 MAG: hypothetical protein FD189_539 [Elusimicrobiota bacterium]
MTAEENRPAPVMRCRMRFERRGGAAGPSHLEQIKELRALVSGSGLEYYGSRGAGDGAPRMAFGPAAGAGHESLCEYADAWFARLYPEEALRSAFSAGARGLALAALRRVPLLFPSIEASASVARFELTFSSAPPEAERRLAEFMAAAEFIAEREKKGEKVRYDLRPAVVSLAWDTPAVRLSAALRLRAGGRAEVLAAALFGPEAPAFTVLRTGLYWEDSSGELREIL